MTSGATSEVCAGAAAQDPVAGADWPYTSRILPWGIALYLVMLFVVPFDAMQLPVTLPVDSKLDRFAILGLGGVWLLTIATAPRSMGPRWRPSVVGFAIAAWLLLLVINVGATVPLQAQLGAGSASIKAISILLSIIALYVIVVTTVRPSEIRPLMTLGMGLASVTAVGLIIEYRTGRNLFFEAARALPGFQVGRQAGGRAGFRVPVAGPTGSPLAAVTLLSLMMPLAVTRALDAVKSSARLTYWLIAFLLIAGALSTQRKTLIVVPTVALLVLAAYRPREVLQLRRLPMVVALLVGLQLLIPGGVSGLRYQLSFKGEDGSTKGRTEDYAAVAPDLRTRPLMGRGYGTYDPRRYRFLDNQYLGLTLSTGFIGVVAYLAVFLAAMGTVHRVARSRGPDAGLAAAIVAALAGFLVCNALYDTLAFRHVPYLMFILIAFGVVMRHGLLEEAQRPADAPEQRPRGDRAAERWHAVRGNVRGRERGASAN